MYLNRVIITNERLLITEILLVALSLKGGEGVGVVFISRQKRPKIKNGKQATLIPHDQSIDNSLLSFHEQFKPN